jgi:hypothetical protein
VTALRQFAEATDPYRLPPSGTRDQLTVPGAESTEVEWLRRDDFSDASWVNRWWVESGGALVRALPSQGLEIQNNPRDPEEAIGTTLWMRADAPERLAVRLRVTFASEEKNNACNLDLILRANQTGDVSKEANYRVSLTGEDNSGGSGVQRNPGFDQPAESKIQIEPGPSYELLCLFDQGRLRTWINGQLVRDWTDPSPLPNGRLGLQTRHSTLQIHSVEVGRLGGGLRPDGG